MKGNSLQRLDYDLRKFATQYLNRNSLTVTQLRYNIFLLFMYYSCFVFVDFAFKINSFHRKAYATFLATLETEKKITAFERGMLSFRMLHTLKEHKNRFTVAARLHSLYFYTSVPPPVSTCISTN